MEQRWPTSESSSLDFADVAVILAESSEILAAALEALSRKAKPLGLHVSRIKTKILAFGDRAAM